MSKTMSTVGNLCNKGYSQENDDISTTLDRIQWSVHYKGRLNMVPRLMFYAIICVFACSCILLNKLPDVVTFMSAVICVWLFLMSFDGFFSHHGDKFCSFAIEQNVEKLRTELKCEKGDFSKLSKETVHLAPDHPCCNFVYSSTI